MRHHSASSRLAVLLATTSLVLLACLPAAAQPAAPPDAGPDQAGEASQDPPALAGRVAALSGPVSFHASGETDWTQATLNYPVTNGEAFWTEAKSQAVLEVADDRLVLASSTELDLGELDTAAFSTTLAQGAVFLELRSLADGQTVTINTPRGAVQINAPGRYEIVAGDTDDATLVSVVDGAAHVAGTDLSLDIGPRQTASIVGGDALQGAVGPLEEDDFLRAQLRPPVRRGPVVALPPAVHYMTGAADLQTYGSFVQTAQYGSVWYPASVPANWAPYRVGHWAYVSPWGWTWVDNERWGFAPFHYGRWVQVQNRWGWVPGEVTVSVGVHYPVYSPALVAFVGVSAGGVNIGLGAGAFVGGVAPAWVPLGPREPYYPWYHVRPAYFAQVNAPYGVPAAIIQRGPIVTNVTNVTNVREVNINRTNVTNVYINARAATVVPTAAFVGGQPIAAVARPLPAAALASAQPFTGRLPVRPTAATPNLPPVVAQRFHVALPARPVQPVAAGPKIVPVATGVRPVPVLPRMVHPPLGVRPVPVARVQIPSHPAHPVAPPLAPRPALAPAPAPALKPASTPTPTPTLKPALKPVPVPAPAPKAVAGPVPTQPAPAAPRAPGLPPLRAHGQGRPEVPATAPATRPAPHEAAPAPSLSEPKRPVPALAEPKRAEPAPARPARAEPKPAEAKRPVPALAEPKRAEPAPARPARPEPKPAEAKAPEHAEKKPKPE